MNNCCTNLGVGEKNVCSLLQHLHCYAIAMALEIFRLDGRRGTGAPAAAIGGGWVTQEPLKDNNTLDILSSECE